MNLSSRLHNIEKIGLKLIYSSVDVVMCTELENELNLTGINQAVILTKLQSCHNWHCNDQDMFPAKKVAGKKKEIHLNL